MNDTPSPDKRKPRRASRRPGAPAMLEFVISANGGGSMRRAARTTKLPPASQAEAQLRPEQTGAALIAVMQARPHREIELESPRGPMPVRSAEP